MKNWLRVTICVMLVVSILAMSLSVFATDGVEVVQAKEALVAYYIWQFLQAVGIDVTYRGILEYGDFIQDTIIDWVIEYIGSLIQADLVPSNYNINQWIAPWQAEYDTWGNLQYNSTMLEDMEDFADWLKSKFSLIDDDHITVSGSDRIVFENGVTFYEISPNIRQYAYAYIPAYTDSENGWEYVYFKASTQTNVPMYMSYFKLDNQDYIRQIFISTIDQTLNYYIGCIYDNDYRYSQESVRTRYNRFPTIGNNTVTTQWYLNYNGGYLDTQFIPAEPDTVYTQTEIREALTGIYEVETDGVAIDTYDILFPSDDPGYTTGDGVTIVDGVPNYGELTFSGTVTNLPAIVSTSVISNPHLEEAYRPIQGLITYAKDGIGVCTSLLYELPDEMVYMWYGLIASIVVWGMIKLMREH